MCSCLGECNNSLSLRAALYFGERNDISPHFLNDALNIIFLSKVHDKAKTVLSRHWLPVTVIHPARIRHVCGGVSVFVSNTSIKVPLQTGFGSSFPQGNNVCWGWSPRDHKLCALPSAVFKAQSLKAWVAQFSVMTSLYSWGETGFVSHDFSACCADGYLCAFKKKVGCSGEELAVLLPGGGAPQECAGVMISWCFQLESDPQLTLCSWVKCDQGYWGRENGQKLICPSLVIFWKASLSDAVENLRKLESEFVVLLVCWDLKCLPLPTLYTLLSSQLLSPTTCLRPFNAFFVKLKSFNLCI